jgi:CheY-like chemotaxis protein
MASAWPHVLLVNDQESGLYLLQHAVVREYPDAVVRSCLSAEDALRSWRTERFDVIITDNRMPRMDGLEFVQRIRAEDGATPILMLTGSAQVEPEARAAGVSDFVSSGSWEQIRVRIRQLVGSGPGV